MRRVASSVAVVVVAALACSCGGSGTTRTVTVTTTARAPAMGVSELPTILCRMSYGAGSAPSSAAPSPTTSAVVPADLAPRLAAYWTPVAVVLAPRGWACAGAVGADGSSEVIAAPKGTPRMTGFNLDPPRSAPSVQLQAVPACQGCVASMICALFPSSPVATEYAFQPCTVRDPPRQRVIRTTENTALFVDPPNVRGQGSPSGAANPAIGALLLRPYTGQTSGTQAGAAATQVTCALPAKFESTCWAIVTDELSRSENP